MLQGINWFPARVRKELRCLHQCVLPWVNDSPIFVWCASPPPAPKLIYWSVLLRMQLSLPYAHPWLHHTLFAFFLVPKNLFCSTAHWTGHRLGSVAYKMQTFLLGHVSKSWRRSRRENLDGEESKNNVIWDFHDTALKCREDHFVPFETLSTRSLPLPAFINLFFSPQLTFATEGRGGGRESPSKHESALS